jgi:hypothetical protein
MNDQWTDRLSEYLDGELAAGERSALEAHLGVCADCRATLDDVRKVVARARALDDRAPRNDLWAGIDARLTSGAARLTPRRWRGVFLSVPQLAAASLLLALLSGGGVWLGLRSKTVTPQPGLAADQESNVRPAGGWSMRTDAAVAELEDILAHNERRLDTATVRVVRQNLAVIDRAIDQARRALAADPRNAYLNLHLADTMRRKVELLRRANELAAAQS